jgi:hypothetical protein
MRLSTRFAKQLSGRSLMFLEVQSRWIDDRGMNRMAKDNLLSVQR